MKNYKNHNIGQDREKHTPGHKDLKLVSIAIGDYQHSLVTNFRFYIYPVKMRYL